MKRLLHLTEDRRTPFLNVLIGLISASVAGALNAGGFLLVGRYTSHVTGLLAMAADGIVLNQIGPVRWALLGVGCYVAGAALATGLIEGGEKLRFHSKFAFAFLFNGTLLLLVGWMLLNQSNSADGVVIAASAFFISMGMQNATVSQLTNFDIRATHMTGMVTDIGIEIMRGIVRSRFFLPEKLKLALGMVASFVLGGIAGAFGFQYGNPSGVVIGLGLLLMTLSMPPIYWDYHIRRRLRKRLKQ